MPHNFTLPNGIVQCDACGCYQPLSNTKSYLDGQICIVCVPGVEAQLDAEAQQRSILSQESKD